MDIKIKICGVRDPDGAQAVQRAGADLAGFNFVPSSRRFIAPASARALIDTVGADRAVGVFRNQDISEIERALLASGVTWIQLHGSETPMLCADLRTRGVRVIKALAVEPGLTSAQVTDYASACNMLLFDAPTPGGGLPFDPAQLCALAPPRPFLLAGGLTPQNVAGLIRTVAPDGVDTASGVEHNGRMHPERVAAFCHAVRTTRTG